MQYYRLSKGLTDNEMYPVSDNPYSLGLDTEQDAYVSLYLYNDDHYTQWKKNKSFKGMTGVTTSKVFFDFDCKDNLEQARKDALELVSRIVQYNVPENDIQMCFSGSKGFSVQIKTDKELTPEELKNIAANLAGDLQTFDPVVYDSQRIIRMLGTRHPSSGLYKMPLSYEQLSESPIQDILSLAKDKATVNEALENFSWDQVSLPEKIYELRFPKKKPKDVVHAPSSLDDINMADKPKFLTPCKFALQEGHFEEGHRRQAIMILAATYKAHGFHFEMVWRMLKGVAEKQAILTGDTRFSDEEIYRASKEVFSHGWKGGQYTCKTDPILQDICEQLGERGCQHQKRDVYSIRGVSELFKGYANDIDKNTIKTGIPAIDDHVRMTIGMHIGILASPGAGKTSAMLEILENTSRDGIVSFFFSMDMYGPLIYQKQIQRQTGMVDKEIFELFNQVKQGNRQAIFKLDQIDKKIEEAYKNVRFFFRSGLRVEEVRDIVLDYQRDTGEVVKLVGLDYAECLSGASSDAFNNSKLIAHKLKDLATQDDLCVLTLVQPPKSAGDASEPLYSMRQVKGPSDWDQGFSVILGMYREGYNPQRAEDDRFITIVSLKNRMGGLFSADCTWHGPTGKISPITEEEQIELQMIRERKSQSKKAAGWGPSH